MLSGAALDLLEEAARLRPDRVLRKPIDLPSLLEWLRQESHAATSDPPATAGPPEPPA